MSNEKNRIRPYLSKAVYQRFKGYCKAHNASESSVADAALQQFFDDSDDTHLLLKRMDRHGRALDRLQRDVEVLSEALGSFVHIWFAHTPKIAGPEQGFAKQQAMQRYTDFLKYVASQVSNGRKFVDELVQDQITDDEELASFMDEPETSYAE